MCGICGAVSFDGVLDPAIRAAIGPMTSALAHRGPDGDGVFDDAAAVLGHRRLAIIDRDGGAQPMATADRSRWVVFNGEIYNHRAVRKRLEGRGHHFRTQSDTEVILQAWEAYGADCVRHLEGMFAFALYDVRTRELLLARDRIGKKPLFYAVLGGALHFASEIKALKCSPAWDGALDLSGLEGYLSLGYFLAPDTAYRHVRQVEPGHTLRLHNGHLETVQYWDVEEFDSDRRTEEDLLPDIEDLLRRAVRDRLESEVPLGAFLSGGIDSGLVVSLMCEATSGPITTTTIGFGSQDDEAATATLTAEHLGCRHFVHTVTPDLAVVLDRVIDTLDQPLADGSLIPTYYVSAQARAHVTVALSGDGGDESFGGYAVRYLPHRLEALARRWGGTHVCRAGAWVGRHWPRSGRLPRWLRAGTVLENLGRDDAASYYADLCLMRPGQARRLLGLDADGDPRASAVYEQVVAPYRRCPSSDPAQRAQYADLKVYLPNAVLVKVDRMSMAHGLEVRAPLLDRRVVEAAFRIPAAVKLARVTSKRLLRRLASRRLPPPIARRGKHGFDAPVGRWLAGPYREQFRDDVLGPLSPAPSYVDRGEVQRLLDEHCRGGRDHACALWGLWVLARWLRSAPPGVAAPPRPRDPAFAGAAVAVPRAS